MEKEMHFPQKRVKTALTVDFKEHHLSERKKIIRNGDAVQKKASSNDS